MCQADGLLHERGDRPYRQYVRKFGADVSKETRHFVGRCDRARPDHHTASALNLHPLEARASPFSPWHACASNVGWPAQWLPPAEYRIDPTARLDAPGLGTHPPVVVRLGWTSLLHARLRGHEPSVR